MARALITGVAGFIGSHVADRCLELGMQVVGIDDLSGGSIENLSPAVDFRDGSVVDAEFLEEVWRGDNFDYVYHLAAYAAEGLSHFIRHYNYTTNLLGSVNLINLAVNHDVKCFVFTSSIAVYGANQVPMTEDQTPMPEDPYGISKYAVELDLKAAHELFGLPYVVFRPHNVYGERQNIGDKYRNVVGIFMNQVMLGEPMTIFGDGTQTRAFSYIDDVSQVIARAPLTPAAMQQVFNVGADRPYAVGDLAVKVAEVFGVEPNIRHLQARQEVLHAFTSHDKVTKAFSPPDPVPLDEGLRRMAEWVRRHGPSRPTDFGKIEIPRNLPAAWRK